MLIRRLLDKNLVLVKVCTLIKILITDNLIDIITRAYYDTTAAGAASEGGGRGQGCEPRHRVRHRVGPRPGLWHQQGHRHCILQGDPVYIPIELCNFDINIRNIQTRLLPVPFPCLSAYLRFQTLDTIVNRHLNKVST